MQILTKIYTFFYIQDKYGEMYVIISTIRKAKEEIDMEKKTVKLGRKMKQKSLIIGVATGILITSGKLYHLSCGNSVSGKI